MVRFERVTSEGHPAQATPATKAVTWQPTTFCFASTATSAVPTADRLLALQDLRQLQMAQSKSQR